jgi:DNA-binding transcriptional regulator YhcF (GntR family)
MVESGPRDIGDQSDIVRRRAYSPVRDRVIETIRGEIREGIYLNGVLPSMDRLAARLDASRVTVRNALKSLEEEGLLRIRQGRGISVIIPEEPQENGSVEAQQNEVSAWTEELRWTFQDAIDRYAGFLSNPEISIDLKIRMSEIIQAQISLVEQAQQHA